MASTWPSQWTALDELYGPSKWTLMVAQAVSRAERAYDIWLHWHESRVMIVDALSGERNWCPLCPPSWGGTVNRFQVGPERRPFVDEDEALAHLSAWIRNRSLGRPLLSPQITEELYLRPQTRLLRGDTHSTIGRLIERLSRQAPPGFRFCGHLHEREFNVANPMPILVPWWSVSSHDSEDPCPLCAMGLPAWSSQRIRSDSLPEDAHAADNSALWQAVHKVHENGVHVVDPSDIDCPDCQQAAEWRLEQGPREPLPHDLPTF